MMDLSPDLNSHGETAIGSCRFVRGWAAEFSTVVAAIALVPLLLIGLERAAFSLGRAGPSKSATSFGSGIPFRLAPLCKVIVPLQSDDHRQIQEVLANPPHPRIDGPVAIHLLRAYGTARIPGSQHSGADLLRLLTGSSSGEMSTSYQPPIVKTRNGARFLSFEDRVTAQHTNENHRDVYLANFGELGLSLSTVLHTRTGQNVTVQDLLSDSLATYGPDQSEIEWSCMSFVLYARSLRSSASHGDNLWNKLALDLLNRDLAKSPCAGSHLIVAMAYLARVDEREHLLSGTLHADVIAQLQTLVEHLLRAQNSDGSWDNDWFDKPSSQSFNVSEALSRVAPTGHLLESLSYLPYELQPTDDVYRRGMRFLLPRLRALRHLPTFNDRTWICAWTHAACALRNLSTPHAPSTDAERTFDEERVHP